MTIPGRATHPAPVPHRARTWCALVLAALAGGAAGQDAPRAITEVAVLGMIHGSHRTSERWGLDAVRETIQRFAPDVICTEIPPDRWDRVHDDWTGRRVIEDDRVLRFPEYTDVLLPLMTEDGFEVEPCAAWTRSMADERQARMQQFQTDPSLSAERDAYTAAVAAVEERLAAHPIVEDDPWVIHSDLYDERTRDELRPYDEHMNEWIGEGGWTNINAAHWRLIDAAIDRHPGQRVLITFGAGHKHWFLDRLRERDDIRLLDITPFLPPRTPPTASPTSTMDESCRNEVVELHQFFEDWFNGRLEQTPDGPRRFADVMAEGFEIVTPEGARVPREPLVQGIADSHGSADGLRIWIDGYSSRVLDGGLLLVSYQEWQERAGVKRGRQSTALFRRRAGTPQGVEWLHVHETWLPDSER